MTRMIGDFGTVDLLIANVIMGGDLCVWTYFIEVLPGSVIALP